MTACAVLLGPAPLLAQPATEAERPSALADLQGRPEVVLDQLDFPKELRGWWTYKKYLRGVLRRHVRRADWGAGRDARIEYRFEVEQLDVRERDGVLTVTCRARGRLPKRKSAVSTLEFSGDPRKKHELIKRVLEIVSRGVITRLAELERQRREAAAAR